MAKFPGTSGSLDFVAGGAPDVPKSGTSGLLDSTMSRRYKRSAVVRPPRITCPDCGRSFGRAAEKARHDQAARCQTSSTTPCPICHKRLTGRADALRRHQLTTRKCLEIQKTLSPEQLVSFGCLPRDKREKQPVEGDDELSS
ncbi:hypothetical protein AURDEDRAFT_176783 [Auricularia subglabra TFB-10046 SS5]|uniref:C2H2-type domain-containing protein n=1 Tax=Auricularia subglabra (strain TFB-10046 / SS5) TaxID=717982 RepID=J0CUW2_AURST|nr:hypothetical protein AURDEDRAFT_176783 [Auricularia subglabra TFB-10046 SS5]